MFPSDIITSHKDKNKESLPKKVLVDNYIYTKTPHASPYDGRQFSHILSQRNCIFLHSGRYTDIEI